MHYTLTPAYGRDYRSAKEVKAAFNSNLDFIDESWGSPWQGKPVNREQLEAGSSVNIRYGKLRKVCVLKV